MKSSAETPRRQAILPERNADFANRMKAAIKGLNQTEVARSIDIAGSTLHRYLNGSMPAADTAFRLARELGVRPEWLIEGEGAMRPGAEVVGVAGQVTVLPRYDLFAFSELGRPDPIDHMALPTAWLMRAARGTTDLWLAEMPSDAMPNLAREGEIMICRDADARLQDRRVYIFLLDGRPVVRRALVKAEGLQLRGESDDDTISVALDDVEHLKPVGRVLSAIHQV